VRQADAHEATSSSGGRARPERTTGGCAPATGRLEPRVLRRDRFRRRISTEQPIFGADGPDQDRNAIPDKVETCINGAI
jgi:hypothetical protein